MDVDSRDKLLREVRQLAAEKLATGQEPPWAWYQYMKLREAVDAILAGRAVIRQSGSPQSPEHPETLLPPGGNIVPLDTVRRRLESEPPLLPM